LALLAVVSDADELYVLASAELEDVALALPVDVDEMESDDSGEYGYKVVGSDSVVVYVVVKTLSEDRLEVERDVEESY